MEITFILLLGSTDSLKHLIDLVLGVDLWYQLGLCEYASIFRKTYVAWLISRSSFQKSFDISVVNTNVEVPGTVEIKGPSAKFRTSIDRCWDVNVDRWSNGMARPLFKAFVYATSCVIALFCILLFVFWNVTLMYEQIFCSIGCLKDVCNIFSRYVQYTSVYCSCVAIWSGCRSMFYEQIDVGGLMSIDGRLALSIGWLDRVLPQAASDRS
ncbi:hypothetical protein F2Q69_00042299 [Brassica cretica]|uniref:Uncharacterized protein n=1 Tax=Brassica cretica TaxID=69181 RepID=A0A8S9NP69_BRACR|nr:hypothetical protein F2Q69_00042299 [Brassica cretica]